MLNKLELKILNAWNQMWTEYRLAALNPRIGDMELAGAFVTSIVATIGSLWYSATEALIAGMAVFTVLWTLDATIRGVMGKVWRKSYIRNGKVLWLVLPVTVVWDALTRTAPDSWGLRGTDYIITSMVMNGLGIGMATLVAIGIQKAWTKVKAYYTGLPNKE